MAPNFLAGIWVVHVSYLARDPLESGYIVR